MTVKLNIFLILIYFKFLHFLHYTEYRPSDYQMGGGEDMEDVIRLLKQQMPHSSTSGDEAEGANDSLEESDSDGCVESLMFCLYF